jgi:hypothetical protein
MKLKLTAGTTDSSPGICGEAARASACSGLTCDRCAVLWIVSYTTSAGKVPAAWSRPVGSGPGGGSVEETREARQDALRLWASRGPLSAGVVRRTCGEF